MRKNRILGGVKLGFTISGEEIVRFLMDCGFEVNRIKGSHYIMKNSETTVPVPVHKGEDIAIGTLGSILRSVHKSRLDIKEWRERS